MVFGSYWIDFLFGLGLDVFLFVVVGDWEVSFVVGGWWSRGVFYVSDLFFSVVWWLVVLVSGDEKWECVLVGGGCVE